MPGSLVAGPPIRHQTELKRLSTQYLFLGRSLIRYAMFCFGHGVDAAVVSICVFCVLSVWCLSERKKAAVEERGMSLV